MKQFILTTLLVLVILLVGCGSDTPPTAVPVADAEQIEPTNTPVPPTDTAVPPSPTSTPLPPTEPPPPTDTPVPPSPTATDIPALPIPPAEPQRIEFTSEDGRQLIGDFYPAAINPAPIAILMHEGLSNRAEVEPIALWLQNRPKEVETGPTGQAIPGWLPPLPEEIGSLAVLTFDMRGHGESDGPMPPSSDSLEYLMDIRAAIATVKTLEGVDPDRIITLGSSMFSEAAVFGCIALDDATISANQPGVGCLGAMSISPFGFYPVLFTDGVTTLLNTPPQPVVWCVHAENDINPDTCRAIDGRERTQATIYPGDTHGKSFYQPGLTPEFGEVLRDFLLAALVE